MLKFLHKKPRNRKLRRWVLLLVLISLLCAAPAIIYSFYFEPYQLFINYQDVKLKNWHPEHNNLKVLVWSDIHQRNSNAAKKRLDELIMVANDQNPDIILLLGDYLGARIDIGNNATPQEIADQLAALKSRYGIYAVLGNHDWWYDGVEMRRQLERIGITVLENEFARITIDDKSFTILGLPDHYTRGDTWNPAILADIPKDDPVIILSHSPDFFPSLELPYELMLAGHTHGGQIVPPLIGPLIIPSKYGTRLAAGWYNIDDRRLFVTVGTGTSILHARFNCMPEIAVMNLQKQP